MTRSSCSLSWEVLGIENLLGPQASLSPLTSFITTPSLPSLPYLKHPPLHLTPSRDFTTKCNWRNRPSFSLLLISFTVFTFPAHPAGFSFCIFTGFLVIFNVVTSQQQQIMVSLTGPLVIGTRLCQLDLSGCWKQESLLGDEIIGLSDSCNRISFRKYQFFFLCRLRVGNY